MASRLSIILSVRSRQGPFEETRLERGEGEIMGSGVEGALPVEDAEGGDRVQMGVGIQERTETLRGDDHGRDRLFAGRKVRREKLACGGVCDLCELA